MITHPSTHTRSYSSARIRTAHRMIHTNPTTNPLPTLVSLHDDIVIRGSSPIFFHLCETLVARQGSRPSRLASTTTLDYM